MYVLLQRKVITEVLFKSLKVLSLGVKQWCERDKCEKDGENCTFNHVLFQSEQKAERETRMNSCWEKRGQRG